MNASNQLISLYRQKLNLATNQSIADKLAVKQPTVSMWLNEKSHPDAESVERMCIATGEPLARWLPLIESERARSPGARKAWLRLAQAAAAIAVATGFTASLDIDTAATAIAGLASTAHNPLTLYIM